MLVSIQLDRDSVHAGDDIESHAMEIDADSAAEIGVILTELKSSYLPGIAGGAATWIVSCSGDGPSPLGVLAQQWQAPRLRIPLETPLGHVLGSGRPGIRFVYLCQKDPSDVFDDIAGDSGSHSQH